MNKFSINRKRIVITGGSGFLGKQIINILKSEKVLKISTPSKEKYDLRDYNNCLKAFKGYDIVIHLAANVGGIGYNQKNPATLFDDNALIGINCVRAAKECDIKKFVAIGTICEYPKFTKVPFQEKFLWDGYPEETNAPYGLAKKMLLVQTKAYYDQFGFQSINLLPVNLYGPGDNFNPDSSHVIPALIKKFIEAKYMNKKEVEVWGSGKATREFLFVEDAARAIIMATKAVSVPDPINIGSGMEISIKKLAEKIKQIVGYKGKIIWNKAMPDGQPRRRLNISRAKKMFGYTAKIKFDDGLKKTIDWYLPQWLKQNDITS